MAARKQRILMGMPSGDTMVSSTAMCWINSAFALDRAGYEISWENRVGTLVSWNQNALALSALEGGFDYLWLVDSDMFWERDVGLDLLARRKSIVGCNYRSRKEPANFTAKHLPEPGVATSTGDTGCREVDYVGTGMLMIHRAVFEKTPRPWFWTVEAFEDEAFLYIGNDVNFCRSARRSGFPVFCDFFASRKVAHIGQYALKWTVGMPGAASEAVMEGLR